MAEVEQKVKKQKIIVKYIGPHFLNKVRFGLFTSMKEWVSFKHDELNQGRAIEFCMSYPTKTYSNDNPFIKEKEFDPAWGSQSVQYIDEDGDSE